MQIGNPEGQVAEVQKALSQAVAGFDNNKVVFYYRPDAWFLGASRH